MTTGTAMISADGRYRYLLTRALHTPGTGRGQLLWIMLNPSTADAQVDDPTIRRCIGFTERLGYTSLAVVNLYAFRTAKPADLWRTRYPLGPDNDTVLRRSIREAARVVVAWGAGIKGRMHRVTSVVRLAEDLQQPLWCLGRTQGGHPRHPLYVKADKSLELFAC